MDFWTILTDAVLFLAGAVAMELVAWSFHKWIMHGPLWVLHEDHHRPHKGLFEKNDLFVVFFAGISFGLIFGGAANSWWGMLWFGLGTALYGVLYTVFHDIIFHKRVKVKVPQFGYLRRIINAHRVHHSGKEDQRHAQAFGFLWASSKYTRFPPK